VTGNTVEGGGGGGGGLFGGGGAFGIGGGGGSSYCSSTVCTNPSYSVSSSASNGFITIEYIPPSTIGNVISNVLISNIAMYPGDTLISENGLWLFVFSSSGNYVCIKSAFTGQVYWSVSFNLATKLFVNNCGVYAFNLFNPTYRGSSAPSGSCASLAFGLKMENSGNLAIVDSFENYVLVSDNYYAYTGILFDSGTAQDLCYPGKFSATGAIPCAFCPAGLRRTCIVFYFLNVN
jgi:hypothetical protein